MACSKRAGAWSHSLALRHPFDDFGRRVEEGKDSRLRRLLWQALLVVAALTIVPVVCLRWIRLRRAPS